MTTPNAESSRCAVDNKQSTETTIHSPPEQLLTTADSSGSETPTSTPVPTGAKPRTIDYELSEESTGNSPLEQLLTKEWQLEPAVYAHFKGN